MEEDLDFFFNNNTSQPKKESMRQKKSCHTINMSIIKSRNLLLNISYNGMKKDDLYDRSCVFDVYVLTTKNINPVSLERKIFDVKDREMIHMFWKECNELSFLQAYLKAGQFYVLEQ